VVGRSEVENAVLDGYAGGRARLEAKGVPGPVALVEGEPTWEERVLAARIVARYGRARSAPRAVVEWREGDLVETYEVEPEADEARIEGLRV
jgi:hypothetical protein